MIWIEGGQVGHGEDGAAGGVHHDGRAAPGPALFDLGREFLLHQVLDRLVHCQDQVGACRRRSFHTAEVPFPGIAMQQNPAGRASHGSLIQVLQTGQSFVVHAHIAKDMGSQLPLGIVALALRLKIDSGQLQPPDLLDLRVVHFPLDPAKGPRPLQPSPNAFRVEPQGLGQAGCRARLVGDFRGDCKYRLDVDTDCQLPVSAIENRPAFRTDLKHTGLLAPGSFPHFRVPDNLQVDEAIADQAGPGEEEQQQKTKTGPKYLREFGRHGEPR